MPKLRPRELSTAKTMYNTAGNYPVYEVRYYASPVPRSTVTSMAFAAKTTNGENDFRDAVVFDPCGVCKPVVAEGEACAKGNRGCAQGSHCANDGVCRAPITIGAFCTLAIDRCVIGAFFVNQVCAAPTFAVADATTTRAALRCAN